MLYYNSKLKDNARELRKNMTDAEKLLWSKIRRKQLKNFQFYRQRIIGDYIVDFYCPKAQLVVELDGGQHYSDIGKENDGMRDVYMKEIGLKVLRFSNYEIYREMDLVLDTIYRSL